jgi:gliding motility-associated-like protein
VNDSIVLGTQNPADFTITYHESQLDAESSSNSLVSPYTNTSNPQTVFIRIEDNNTGCFETTSFNLSISSPTHTAESVDIIGCDDDNDGVVSFDLNAHDVNVLNGQDPTEFNVSYYSSEADAMAGIGALSSPYNSSGEIIYVRVETVAFADCYVTNSFNLIIGAQPDSTFVLDDIITCDDASDDGFEDFDLESQTSIVIGSQNPSDFNVSYHLSLADAQLGIGALSSPYTNISNPQTVFVRVENVTNGCSIFDSFDLIISGPTPTANPNVVYPECDNDFDGITGFDLASQDGNILEGQSASDFTVSYYESESDAAAGTNAIDSSSFYSSASATIFVRVESNIAVDCFSTTTMELLVDPLPDTSFTMDFDYEVCPDATVPIEIMATANNYAASDVTISWTLDGVPIAGQSSLTLPVLTSGLYEIQVTNNLTGCTSTAEQEVIELESCVIPQGISPNGDGRNDTFDLSSYDVDKLEIFNRNGTLVYSKRNYTNEWFGQSNDGDELPVGVYFYTMDYDNGKRRAAWIYIQREN